MRRASARCGEAGEKAGALSPFRTPAVRHRYAIGMPLVRLQYVIGTLSVRPTVRLRCVNSTRAVRRDGLPSVTVRFGQDARRRRLESGEKQKEKAAGRAECHGPACILMGIAPFGKRDFPNLREGRFLKSAPSTVRRGRIRRQSTPLHPTGSDGGVFTEKREKTAADQERKIGEAERAEKCVFSPLFLKIREETRL